MTPVKDIAVIGAGVMGADIAAVLAAGGLTTHLVARPGPSRDSLDGRLAESLSSLERIDARVRVNVVNELRDVPWPQIQLAIESVTENLPAKRAVFLQLTECCSDDVILASNTSGIPITHIGADLPGRQRMLNLHFFMPAHLVPLVEVVCGELTDVNIARGVFDLMTDVGMRPVLVRRDLPGFLANRLQHALMREAWSLIDRGVATAADIDTAVRFGFGFRYVAAGPMLQKDLSGLAVHLDSSRGIYPDLCNDAAPAQTLQNLVMAGNLGIKSGKGLYDWPPYKVLAEQTRYQRALTHARALLREDKVAHDQSQRECVVLIHGLYLSGWVLGLLAWRLRRRGFATRLFSYASVRDGFQLNSVLLADFLRAIDAPIVHLVAHSLGGLLALSVLAVEPTLRRGRLVLLGTPSQGSRVANELLTGKFGSFIIGKCMPEANFHAPFVAPRGVETGVIAGTRAFGLGRLVTKLATPNDGTVTVAETSVRGAAANTRISVTHTTLIFSAAVADLAAWFLRTGEFSQMRG